VVASLWSVSDPATSVLMEEFYNQLWRSKQPPLEALRQAQLVILRDPDRVRRRAAELARLLVKRGARHEDLASRGFEVDAEAGKAPVQPTEKRSPLAWWAAWIVSGAP
jgi:CHAT domain-containing protein